MVANTLLFPALSFVVLLGVAVIVLRLRQWRHATPETGHASATSLEVDLAETLEDPMTWTVGFFLLVLVAVAGALAVVGALPVPEGAQPLVGAVLLLVAAIVLGGFVFAGTYSSVRGRGYGSAPATGLAALVVGMLALLAVIVNLFLGIGSG